jgi:hypothetical protein
MRWGEEANCFPVDLGRTSRRARPPFKRRRPSYCYSARSPDLQAVASSCPSQLPAGGLLGQLGLVAAHPAGPLLSLFFFNKVKNTKRTAQAWNDRSVDHIKYAYLSFDSFAGNKDAVLAGHEYKTVCRQGRPPSRRFRSSWSLWCTELTCY